MRPDQQPRVIPFRDGERRGDQGRQKSNEIVHRGSRCATKHHRAIAEQHGTPLSGMSTIKGATPRGLLQPRARVSKRSPQQESAHGHDLYCIGRQTSDRTRPFVLSRSDSSMMCSVIVWAEFMTILAAAARSGH